MLSHLKNEENATNNDNDDNDDDENTKDRPRFWSGGYAKHLLDFSNQDAHRNVTNKAPVFHLMVSMQRRKKIRVPKTPPNCPSGAEFQNTFIKPSLDLDIFHL